MKKTEKKEKPTPKRCVCGLEAITVKTRAGKMVSCPNPIGCRANLRTTWKSNEWNGLIDSFYAKNRNKRGDSANE